MSSVLALAVLLRPRGAALVVCLPLLGFGYGLWERGSVVGLVPVLPELSLLSLAWLFGHAGAMWLNASLDRDEGAVLLGRAVPVPRIAGAAGYVALACSPLIALATGTIPFACALVCAVLSVLYSHPRTAWKARPIEGPLVNGLGYGALSPIAGWAAASGVPSWRALVTLSLIVLAIFGIYFAAQAFQGEEDRRRGYRTLVVTHGAHRTLAVAHVCLTAAWLGALIFAGLGAYPRAILVSAPLWAWADLWLRRWRRAPEESRASGLVARLTAAGLVTLLAVYADQVWTILYDHPPGGCGTDLVPASILAICT